MKLSKKGLKAMGNKVLKICCGTWKNASHDKRELSVYKELGEEIYVVILVFTINSN